MANEQLKHAMIAAHIDIDTIVNIAGVDEKTVQRWIKGRVPHPRHRRKVAELLKTSEYDLWPSKEAPPSNISEVVAAYAHRSDVSPDIWWQLFLKARKQIDLLGIALLFLPKQHPHLVDLFKEKANAGCKIRIALANPQSVTVRMREEEEHPGTLVPRIQTTLYHLQDILRYEGIQIRYHSTVLYNSYTRADEEMFIMPQLYKLHGSKAPLLHLRCSGPDGIFANFAAHFEAVWETTTALMESNE